MKEAQKERAAAAREQKKLTKPARTLQGGFLPEFRGVISDENQWKDMVSLANRKTLFFVLVRWSAGGWKHETIQQFGKPTGMLLLFLANSIVQNCGNELLDSWFQVSDIS